MTSTVGSALGMELTKADVYQGNENYLDNYKQASTEGREGWVEETAMEEQEAVCLSCIRSIKNVNMSSDNEYEIRELRKEIDYLAEDVEKLKRLVKNMKDINSLKLTADDEEYLRGID